ncbi:hypothetical protein KFE25_001266 [Diacronema lutheri]|uniref:tRNA (guanine(46)-N(7))-methyltransferase n=1 Tax=Diacronema lutheri TaxID=2081491 RepID=A0A8J6CBM8_DIALT|nr:hypothetical protein KFE25_001266 [Diacronema lutheri]
MAASTERAEAKLARLSAKLEALTGPEDKRVRKRVFAAIGKLNKELAVPPAPHAPSFAPAARADEPRAAKRQRRAEPAAAAQAAAAAQVVPAVAHAPHALERAPKVAALAGRRADNRRLNHEIAALAKRKQLGRAEELFARALAQGLADVHTHTNMINAAVRCAQLERAEKLLARMEAGDGPAPNVVAYTAMLKGYAAAGRMRAAQALLVRMARPRVDAGRPVLPNLRTVHTLLRGCVRTGDVRLAEWAVSRMGAEWACAPDACAYEALALLLCQSLRVRRVRALLDSLRSQCTLDHAPDDARVPAVHPCRNAAILLALARAHALLAQWARAADALASAQDALDGAHSVAALVRQRDAEAARDGGVGRHGARARVHLSARSVLAFLEHRRAEQVRELRELEVAVRDGAARAADAPASAALARAFARLLVIPPEVPRANLARALCAASVQAAREAFGLQAFATHAAKQPGGVPARELLARLRARLGLSFSDGGGARLRIASLFAEEGEDGAEAAGIAAGIAPGVAGIAGAARRARVHVELCCGGGEWLVQQAAHDARAGARVLWAGVELRADRAAQAFSRAALARLDNCAVLCADAAELFATRLQPGAIDAVCVNHPQPPEWSGGAADSEGEHLLTHAFFSHVHAALRPGGSLTIVTDNVRYGRSLASALCAFDRPPLVFAPLAVGVREDEDGGEDERDAHGSGGEHRLAPGEQGRVPLHEGVPPEACGYTVRASSYFDRLWAHGKRTRRFFVAVRRA